MPVTSVTSDPSSLTLTAIGDYPVPIERLWAAWADPRQLERFWGPPEWPATFTRHDMVEGGRSEYAMTGPSGGCARGYWRFVRVEAPRIIEVLDGFANEDGSPNEGLPESKMVIRFESTPTGSRFVNVATFASVEAMEQLLAMGMQEGLTAAMAQLDLVLADLRESTRDHPGSAGARTTLEVLDDTTVVVRREVRGSASQIWRCHHEAALVQRWMLGPDGWTMPVCEVATRVGDVYRYEWENSSDGARFGFTGELLESEAPRRAVTTERMIGMDGPGTVNELLLTPLEGDRTRIEIRIQYPSKELRDFVLGTGMVDGMETSYARLEKTIESRT
ncbi:MAG: SRPBCC domain-containing protein [Myxococcales bacterium]|nr:SRPBCC domain-containing protein [Myxococcales bacterium]